MTRRNNEIWREGVLVEIKQFDATWDMVRDERNMFLAESDAWMLPDRYEQLSSAQKTELTTYRQTLRDIPQNHTEANDAYDAIPDTPSWL
tara:strand:+ start:239 stop:508 length:270 start_codon:yes stop_codon:yes gene_type:complete